MRLSRKCPKHCGNLLWAQVATPAFSAVVHFWQQSSLGRAAEWESELKWKGENVKMDFDFALGTFETGKFKKIFPFFAHGNFRRRLPSFPPKVGWKCVHASCHGTVSV